MQKRAAIVMSAVPFARRALAVAALGATLAAILTAQAAHAQGVLDPTRPPAAEAVAGREGAPSGLQSVLISDNRKAAIIGGQLVELGHKYGDATLVRVSENEVILARGRETQVLRLFPGVDKKMTPASTMERTPASVKKKVKSREIR